MPQDTTRFSSAFSAIQELQLNTTLIPWGDVKQLLRHTPSLTALEYGYNRLSNLRTANNDPAENTITNAGLRLINFDGNELTGWAEIVAALRYYPKYALIPFSTTFCSSSTANIFFVHSLERVILSSNQLKTIDPLEQAPAFHQLRHLSLTSNALDSWQSIDRLHLWCPSLESLTISGNPIVEGEYTLSDPRLRATIE